MINTIDLSFIKTISNELEGFKKSNNNYNFRCPYCGDSARSKTKKRGWFIDYKGTTFFKCFNCGKAVPLKTFLKDFDEHEYQRYLIYKNTNVEQAENTNSNKYISKDKTLVIREIFNNNQYINNCSKMNDGTIYLKGRKLTHPELFYYTTDYGNLLKSLNLEEYKVEWDIHEPRLVIPHFDKENKLMFLQFRDMSPNCKLRYKTYRILEDVPKVWGLDRIDWNKYVRVVEGAIDASFLDNCLAMSGADVDLSGSLINNYKDELYFILDNEPYNKEICNRYRKLCDKGYNVFIWPNVEPKDINDYYLKYGNVDVFSDKSRFYKGLKLKLELARWTKC